MVDTVMSEINIHDIYRQERSRWLREEAPRKSLRDVIAESVRYWIILVALVLYGLSAPHTASVFDKLTPGWGWIAPIGVEFGLLYTAFRRRVSHSASERVSWTLWFLEVLLFLTAMLVNGAGAFTSVVTSMNLDQLSFAALVEQFGTLPATSQAALVMAVLSAFIIPIGTLVAGEGLALLVLERRTGLDMREAQWQEVAFTTTYRALFVRHLQSGLPDKDARQKALAEAKGYLGAGRPSSVRSLSAGSGQAGQVNGQSPDGAKTRVFQYLEQHVDAEQLSVNQLWDRLQHEGIQVGRTTVAQALKECKQRASA
jgi:hypothetical protein